jgi:hypothetical protein
MDLKTILNNVLGQSGFLQKGGFSTSADPDDIQMVAIANRTAYEIMNYFLWSNLRTQAQINMQSGQSRYQLPPDYQDFVPDSAWETEGERQVEWPVPDGRWFLYKFTSYSDGGTYRVKKYGNEIEIHDANTDEAFNYEYISKWVVVDEQGARKELFTADSDTFLLDDQLLILGIQAHWQQAKLMPSYTEHFGNYQRKMHEAIGRDSSGSKIGGVCGYGNWIKSRSPYYPLYRK